MTDSKQLHTMTAMERLAFFFGFMKNQHTKYLFGITTFFMCLKYLKLIFVDFIWSMFFNLRL